MIGKLKELLLNNAAGKPDDTDVQEDKLRLSLAALLVEMARADFDESSTERAEIGRLLGKHYGISETDAQDLLGRAQVQVEDSVSLHDFTRALHSGLSNQQKESVIFMLWQVALADDHLDRYEDYLIRKLADLLYVTHSDLIRIKHAVLESVSDGG
ncbi:MAG: TerB family tellurite resistance protein [Gammaproteobacteria bacterium]